MTLKKLVALLLLLFTAFMTLNIYTKINHLPNFGVSMTAMIVVLALIKVLLIISLLKFIFKK